MNGFEEVQKWEEARAQVFEISKARRVVRKTVKLTATVLVFVGMLALYTYLEFK